MNVLKFLWILIALPTSALTGASELNTNDEGIALHGYDPVAYVLDQVPTVGNPEISSTHEGATYFFSSQKNLELFMAGPERFTPQYGGYCSYGVRIGKKFDIDPQAYSVVDNRLFMLFNAGAHTIWLQDRDKNIEIADRLWPAIRSVPTHQLTGTD